MKTEHARNPCSICGQLGWKGNPVTRQKADPEPKHLECRRQEMLDRQRTGRRAALALLLGEGSA